MRVPELVAGFVNGDASGEFVCRGASQRVPAVKSVGYSIPPAPLWYAGIDDGDVAVRIRPVPLAVVAQGRRGRGEVAILLAGMLGLHQQPHVDRRQARMLEPLPMLHVVGARRPREVVHVVLRRSDGSSCRRRCRCATVRCRSRRRPIRAARSCARRSGRSRRRTRCWRETGARSIGRLRRRRSSGTSAR